MPKLKMDYGCILRNKETGKYGTLHYSTFGGSVHVWDEKNNALGKSLGDSLENILEHWDVCMMPKGYEWNESKLYIRKVK